MRLLVYKKYFWLLVVTWLFSASLAICPYVCPIANAATPEHYCNDKGPPPDDGKSNSQSQSTQSPQRQNHSCCQQSSQVVIKKASPEATVSLLKNYQQIDAVRLTHKDFFSYLTVSVPFLDTSFKTQKIKLHLLNQVLLN